jgi:hypothetical protein
MSSKSISVLMCLIFLSIPICALSQNGESRYDILLDKIKNKKVSVDDKEFKELRFAYTETPQYNPYGGIKVEVGEAMMNAFNNKEYSKAIEFAEKILNENYVDIDAHMVASTAYRKTGNLEKADYHRYIVAGLMNSLVDGNHGEKPETAIDVISTDEEYALLNLAGLRMSSQAELKVNGHDYDKLTVVDSASGKTFEMYFCIDKPYNWLQNSFKKSK